MSRREPVGELRRRPGAVAPEQAVALRLAWAGHEDEVIACALDVAVESVPGILDVARRKLDRLTGPSPDGGSAV